MKLSEYVKHLQGVLKNEGDMDLVYTSDDEGNSFHELYHTGDIMYFESTVGNFLEEINTEELEDYPDHQRAYCIN